MLEEQIVEESRQQLQTIIERWYVWLCSNPSVLFSQRDEVRMKDPVIHYAQTNEWLSRSAVAYTDWFLDKGSPLILSRLEKGDYDAYEP
ncbi:hypothetical protein SAMN03159341_101686 [Paenibacillus sp. 1_12]|uniref:hypothetical protein n=1 Tax=Paenibacillus sp. 1_12 TaxID=1566278 RepID=UPI0008E9B77E|nr:hypothetical protein [Paenibacillus sp. 1_12]SFK81265.1 hypothetical protein SAMN03159341_101686 [Paenibacillus sp. 1_12]